MLCFCGLPARTFEAQEVENLAARSRKKLLMYRKPQEGARSTAGPAEETCSARVSQLVSGNLQK